MMDRRLVLSDLAGMRFAHRMFNSSCDVLARQRLVPTYPKERVRQLISTMTPGGQLLLLRVRTSRGQPAASGIFHAIDPQQAYGWGFASFQRMQHLHPNELPLFHAKNWWRARGYTIMDLAGSGPL